MGLLTIGLAIAFIWRVVLRRRGAHPDQVGSEQ